MRNDYKPEKWELPAQDVLRKIKTKDMPLVAIHFLKKVSTRALPRLVSASEKLNVSSREIRES
jgi:hypothetical protein